MIFGRLDSALNVLRRQTTPVLPTFIDFDIPKHYRETVGGERYLLTDRTQCVDGEVRKRLIIFATDEQLRILFGSSHILMDGTFSSAPPHFEQIYSIHAIKNDQSKLHLYNIF